MTRTKKWILIGVGCSAAAGLATIFIAARHLRNRFEPYIKEQAIRYLSERFDADVELEGIHVRLPAIPQLKLWITRGAGALADVYGEGVVLRRKGRPREPPILAIRSFSFSADLGRVFDQRKEIMLVTLDGLQVHVPPKEDRPKLPKGKPEELNRPPGSEIVLEEIRITNLDLVLHPSDPKKDTLEFQIQKVRLRTNGLGEPMAYEASLHIPKPSGQIESTGTFGPWNREDPGSSPLKGDYTFSHADLGVFNAIAGILESKGTFEGELQRVIARGEAHVPDFRLKRSGNPLFLETQFECEVDGTNGNTKLQPVHAKLGRSPFVTSGAIIKHEKDPRRTIGLNVKMDAGRMEDFMRLAMMGPSFLEGSLKLDANIKIPPLSGKVIERLELKGMFELSDGRFLMSRIQDKIDELSRKGQGQPKNEAIDEVVSHMAGEFAMEDQAIEFSRLQFGVQGADVDIAGKYDLNGETLDFTGSLALVARVSQTQTGVKRWILKPVDPIFAKNGAGTFLNIQIGGTRDKPTFGLAKKKQAETKVP